MGDNVNVTAHLSSQVGPGKILIGEAVYAAARLDLGNPGHRELELRVRVRGQMYEFCEFQRSKPLL